MAIERRVRLRVVLRAIEEYKGMSALCAFCARFALFCAVVYLHRGVWDGSARAEAITAITAFGGDDYHETVLADQTLLRVGAGREDRQRKVSLAVHQDDVVFALQGVNFFRNLIGEGRGGNAGTSYVRGRR